MNIMPLQVSYPVSANWRPRRYSIDPLVLPAGIAGIPQRAQVQIEATEDSHFILLALQGVSALAGGGAGFWYTQLTRNGSEGFMSDFMHSRALWGTQFFPYVLPFPIVISPGETFQGVFQNLSAPINTLSLSFHGIQVFAKEKEVKEYTNRLADGRLTRDPIEFYAYVMRRVFTPGQQTRITVPVAGQKDFMFNQINGTSDAPFSAQISIDGSASGQLMDNYILDQNFLGDAGHPGYIHPCLVGRSNTLAADVTNLSAIPPNNTVEIDLIGLKIPQVEE